MHVFAQGAFGGNSSLKPKYDIEETPSGGLNLTASKDFSPVLWR